MKKTLTKITLLLLVVICANSVFAQQKLSLQDAITMATDSSLAAFRARHMYLASYWEFRTYKAQDLPQLSLATTPIKYDQNFVLRYNSDTNTDEYRSQQTINSSVGLSLKQNVNFLGGTFYVDSRLQYVKNFSTDGKEQFSAVPVTIGYTQPLFGYNQMRWNKKIEPIKFEAAKRHLLYSIEEVAENLTNLFFGMVLAQTNYKTALTNITNAKSLYEIGQKKYEIASISKSDLLSLNLDMVNAKNDLENSKIELKRAKASFTTYLGLDEQSDIELITPDIPVDVKIDPVQALEFAKAANPKTLEFYQRDLEAQSRVQKAKLESRFSASLRASVGFNQTGANFASAYQNLIRQDMIYLSLDIPIIDWGIAKGRYNTAKSNYNMTKVSIAQEEISLWQDVVMTVSEFNIQKELISSASQALSISSEVYESTMQRFIIGKADINSLTLSLDRQNTAQKNYIAALKNYWISYAKIKRLTLYDYQNNTSLSESFDLKYGLIK